MNFLSPAVCYTQTAEDPSLTAMLNFSNKDQVDQGPSYTINFNNVPVIEVIRFVSKVTNMNFVFKQDEIQFNVTIISEEPISVKNLMSALIQVLRINGMTLLEQDNNLIITKSTDVNQIPTIISGDIPDSDKTQAPLVTRVFRIKNANVNSLAGIIKPLISKAALVEVSTETRQLIVTDITTNVDKIAALLSSLDAPHTPLEIDSYEVKNVPISEVISLTTQILSAFTEGNPLILVPQNETSTIFIVSTPHLIERSIAVMEDIDVKPKFKTKEELSKIAPPQAVYVYNIANRNPQEILSIIQQVSKQLTESDPAGSALLIQTLKSAKYISDTNSILFVTDSTTWIKVQEILSSVDAHIATETSNLFIYPVKNMSGSSLLEALRQTTEISKDQDLYDTVKNAKWIKESNTVVFSGSQMIIKKIQSILPTIDISHATDVSDLKNNFLLYTPKYKSGKEIESSLKETAKNLKNGGLTNQSVISTLESARWASNNNNILITGDSASLQKVQEIINSIDTPTTAELDTKNNFLIYTPKYKTGKEIQSSLNETT
ncbi:MAG: hypothetical protein FJZ57_04435, partial [Chlamydiae bacterium]|nr:hypothetical protein [Chlamydiota bacterium]